MRRPLAWLLLALFIVALIVLVAGPSRHLATGEDSLEVVDEPRAVGQRQRGGAGGAQKAALDQRRSAGDG